MEKGVQRWLIDISKWDPSRSDFSSALSVLPQHQRPSVLRFVKMEDRKRALVSRLLQYALVHEVLGIPLEQIVIERTSEGKPYLDYGGEPTQFPNFNFNASHHGDYVAIASEPLCLVGVDVVSYMPPRNETIPEFIESFTPYFSTLEWERINSAATSDEVLAEFYRYWCLKEAFVKAIGSGLAFGLDKVEFHHTGWTDIHVKVNGATLPDWKFSLHELGGTHCLAVAKGHPRLATDSYKTTFRQLGFSEEEYTASLHLLSARFVLKTVGELVSIFASSKIDVTT